MILHHYTLDFMTIHVIHVPYDVKYYLTLVFIFLTLQTLLLFPWI